jgi:diacylglycerol kinase family enzyme
MNSDITLGVLPLGTMNLFAQALGFTPLLETALDELATAVPKEIDVGVVDGRVFLLHVSFGLQPRMAKLRERLGYRSRLTKMLASARALLTVVMVPKSVRVNVELDGQPIHVSAPALVISNNPLASPGVASLPSSLDAGVLGYYTVNDVSPSTLLRLARDYMRNSIHLNDAVETRAGQSVTIRRRPRRLGDFKRRKGILTTIDGEIVVLNNPVTISIQPKSLKVLALPKA